MLTQHYQPNHEKDSVELADHINFNVEGLAEMKLGAIEELVPDEYVNRCLIDTGIESDIASVAVAEINSYNAVDDWVRYLQSPPPYAH